MSRGEEQLLLEPHVIWIFIWACQSHFVMLINYFLYETGNLTLNHRIIEPLGFEETFKRINMLSIKMFSIYVSFLL